MQITLKFSGSRLALCDLFGVGSLEPVVALVDRSVDLRRGRFLNRLLLFHAALEDLSADMASEHGVWLQAANLVKLGSVFEKLFVVDH